MIRIVSLFLCSLLILSCKKDMDTADPIIVPKDVELILYLEQNIMEIWDQDTLLNKNDFAVENTHLPIGIFELEEYHTQVLKLRFPDAFRQRKAIIDKSIFQERLNQAIHLQKAIHWDSLAWRVDRMIIVPGELDQNNTLKATYPSPHWLSELYAQLELILLEKKKKH